MLILILVIILIISLLKPINREKYQNQFCSESVLFKDSANFSIPIMSEIAQQADQTDAPKSKPGEFSSKLGSAFTKSFETRRQSIRPRLQFCKLSNYDNKRMTTPINMILNDIKPFKLTDKKKYVESNIVLSIEEINTILSNVKTTSKKYNFKQLIGIKYNLVDPPQINIIPDKYTTIFPKKLFNMVSKEFKKKLISKTDHCNANTPCKIILKDSRILKIGKFRDNIAIEGQLLIKIKDRNMEILIRHVVSDINKFTIHYIKLEGYDLANFSSDLTYDNVNIYSEPIVNTYKGNKTYLTSSNERLLTDVKVKPILDENLRERCYGKSEFNKMDCEKKFDSFGKPLNIFGIWDKPCVTNQECPFYKANKNFTNSLGGCINNRCQMPLGIETKGPTRHKPIKLAVCGNCKIGVNCCEEQQDTKKYPNLKSPDYRFQDDSKLRMDQNLQ